MGSLLSRWLVEQSAGTHIWLLGRSGRGPWDPASAGRSMVTMARSDVSAAEEASFAVLAAGQTCSLRVPAFCADSFWITVLSWHADITGLTPGWQKLAHIFFGNTSMPLWGY